MSVGEMPDMNAEHDRIEKIANRIAGSVVAKLSKPKEITLSGQKDTSGSLPMPRDKAL